jgi:ribosomal protein S18 acetylase RimI-like enzyme
MDPRPATAADLPAIREVVGAAYARYLSRMDRPPAPMLADYGAAVDAGRLWVTGQPVAGLIELTEDGDALHVGNVAVHPGSQGTGLGRLLMDFAERRAILLGLTRLSLYTNEVMTENQAIYTHLGYREVDRHAEDGYRRVYMEKLLAPRP